MGEGKRVCLCFARLIFARVVSAAGSSCKDAIPRTSTLLYAHESATAAVPACKTMVLLQKRDKTDLLQL